MELGLQTGCACTCAAPRATAPGSLGSAVPAASAAAVGGGPATFNVATFNVLGQSHTAPGGNKPGWRSGVERVDGMIDSLRRWRVDVAGLQEFQEPQQAAFRRGQSEYAMEGDRDNVVVWRRDTFEKVRSTSLEIPYFEGNARTMPAVLLRHRQTGQQAWFVNVHNPASTRNHPDQGTHRAEALRRERAFVKQLRASGLPVYLVGDFNDRAEARSAITGGGLATAAAPREARIGIDQIFGSGNVRFSGWHRDWTPERTQVSDHPIVVARTTIG